MMLLLAIMATLAPLANAQWEDEIYYNASKKGKTAKAVKETVRTEDAAGRTDVDVDAYNMRSFSRPAADTIGVRVAGEPDFVYTDKLQKFYNPTIIVENAALLSDVLNNSYGNVNIVVADGMPAFDLWSVRTPGYYSYGSPYPWRPMWYGYDPFWAWNSSWVTPAWGYGWWSPLWNTGWAWNPWNSPWGWGWTCGLPDYSLGYGSKYRTVNGNGHYRTFPGANINPNRNIYSGGHSYRHGVSSSAANPGIFDNRGDSYGYRGNRAVSKNDFDQRMTNGNAIRGNNIHGNNFGSFRNNGSTGTPRVRGNMNSGARMSGGAAGGMRSSGASMRSSGGNSQRHR